MVAQTNRLPFNDVDSAPDVSLAITYLDEARSLKALKDIETRIVELVNAARLATVIEIGAGCGDLAARLALTGVDCLATDKSVGLVSEAKRRHTAVSNLKFAVCDFTTGAQQRNLEAIGLKQGRFEGLIANRVIQHVADPRRVFRNAIEWLRHGALIVVSDVDWKSLHVEHSNQEIVAKIVADHCRAILNPNAGEKLQSILNELCSKPVDGSEIIVNTMTEFETAANVLAFRRVLARLADQGDVSSDDAKRWLDECQERAEKKTFVAKLSHRIIHVAR